MMYFCYELQYYIEKISNYMIALIVCLFTLVTLTKNLGNEYVVSF